MAATDAAPLRACGVGCWRRAGAPCSAGLLAAARCSAVDAARRQTPRRMVHSYDGGGVTATGPALLVRKNLADKVSRSPAATTSTSVSNASIDVVTTASPYKETRNDLRTSASNYVVRDTLITVLAATQPGARLRRRCHQRRRRAGRLRRHDHRRLGFTRGADEVGKKGTDGYFDHATHWHYRARRDADPEPDLADASANFEAISDDGYPRQPLPRGARLRRRGARTQPAHPLQPRRSSCAPSATWASATWCAAAYRYFWDNWAITAHTVELGYSPLLRQGLAGRCLRALLHPARRAVLQRQRQRRDRLRHAQPAAQHLQRASAWAATVTYTAKRCPAATTVKLTGALEHVSFKYSDFTDVRTGQPYSFDALLLQLFVSADLLKETGCHVDSMRQVCCWA